MEKALIAMSGGVDSSVAALLMSRKYECIGANMRLYDNETVGTKEAKTCCSLDDAMDARRVADKIGMPFYVLNFEEDFKEKVISNFVDCYQKGMTPNPCIDCNRFIKFEKFMLKARELGCSCIATGHYAKVEYDKESGRYLLKKARDTAKDQSYVLAHMTQEQLAFARFPLGNMCKSETRAMAEKHGFANAKKHDSQDICFVPNGNYGDFICTYTGEKAEEGYFTDPGGNILGKHRGIWYYTIGQRKGLGISSTKPYYVSKIDVKNNIVEVADEAAVYGMRLRADHLNLILVKDIEKPVRVKAKIRYRQAEQWATVKKTGEDEIEVKFDKPQRAITLGQTIVLYQGDCVFGAGIISKK